MTIAQLQLTIAGVSAVLEAGTLDLEDRIAARSSLSFRVLDFAGTSHYSQGNAISIVDPTDGSTVFSGYVHSVRERRNSVLGGLTHDIKAVDSIYLADKRLAVKTYAGMLAGDMVSDLVASYLAEEGVIGHHVSRVETTQADWQAVDAVVGGGTLSALLDATTTPGSLQLKQNAGSYGPTQPTFTRATTAYRNSDGVQVTSGNPRYEPGGISSSQAIRIEEGVTNILSANQSSVETDTTGFAAAGGGVTLTRDTTQHWTGAASLKVVADGTVAFQGMSITIPAAGLVAGATYVFSAYVFGASGQALVIKAQNAASPFTGYGSTGFTGANSWQRVSAVVTLPGTLPANVQFLIFNNGTFASTFYVDGMQIEQRAHATSWQVGGTARNAESLALPALGCINPEQGTIQFRANFDSVVNRSEAGLFNWLFGMGPAGTTTNAFNLYHDPNDSKWHIGMADASAASFSPGASGSLFTVGWHNVAVGWDAASALLYLDGTLVDTLNSPHLIATMPALAFLGSSGDGAFNQANTLYQDVRISSRKRTAAELAADAARTTPLPLDADTVYILDLNGAIAANRAAARVSPRVALDPVGTARSATIAWTATLNSSTLIVETSVDGGATWQPASNGGSVGGIGVAGSDFLDGFDTDTSAIYTASAGGVFAWDTANSQVVATGGTQATCEQTGVDYTDVTVSVEMDQAEDAGVFARKTGATTYYLLAIRDGSSGQVGGSTKNLQLYRDNAGVFTDLGGVNVTWPRGSRHRFAFKLVGSALSVLMDDVVVFTTTDTGIAGAGKVGLRHNSAVPGRFQSLIAQGAGTSLAGKSLLVRQTVASGASGANTPVLADITLTLRSSLIDDGPTVTNVIFGYAPVSACIDKLAEVANFWWNIDHQKRLTFRKRAALVAPRVVDGTVSVGSVLEDESVELTVQNGPYRNREYLTGGTDITVLQTESFKGDGTTQSFALRYRVARVPSSVTVNGGAAKTLGIKGLDTGRDFYWSKGDNILAQDAAGVKLISTDTLQVQYVGLFDTVYVAQDYGAVTTMQAAEGAGSTGIVETADPVAGLDNATALAQFAGAKLSRYALTGRQLAFTTTVRGFKAGQTVLVYVPWHNLNGVQMLITAVKVHDVDGLRLWYDITAVVGPFDDTWPAFFLALARQGVNGIDSVAVGQSGTLLVPLLYSEAHGHGDSFSVTSFPAVFPQSTGLYPSTSTFPV